MLRKTTAILMTWLMALLVCTANINLSYCLCQKTVAIGSCLCCAETDSETLLDEISPIATDSCCGSKKVTNERGQSICNQQCSIELELHKFEFTTNSHAHDKGLQPIVQELSKFELHSQILAQVPKRILNTQNTTRGSPDRPLRHQIPVYTSFSVYRL